MNKSAQPKPWSQKKKELKNKYASLSDEDLIYEKGKEEQLLSRIQHKLGKSKKEVKRLIKSL
jgi:uncharacterized protein YjbJ (UPF0337 family)